jgi:carboxymethylenebutenolidase
MIIRTDETTDVPTPTGPMRVHWFRPAVEARYPGLLFFSEIYQVTAPIRRMAAILAGHGYVVGVPEV